MNLIHLAISPEQSSSVLSLSMLDLTPKCLNASVGFEQENLILTKILQSQCSLGVPFHKQAES